MRLSFRAKILAGLLLVGTVPLVLMGGLSYFTNRSELAVTIGQLQTQTATDLAGFADRVVADAVQSLRITCSYIPFGEYGRAELRDVLRIPYQQIPAVSILALFDESGKSQAAPIMRRADDDSPQLVERAAVTKDDLSRFAGQLPPLELVLETGAAVGPPYRSVSSDSPRVAIAVRVADDSTLVIAAEISLAALEQRLQDLRGETQGYVTTRDGTAFARSESDLVLSAAEKSVFASVFAETGTSLAGTAARASGGDWLVAAARVPALDWAVVIAQPEAIAFRTANRVRSFTILWVVLALLLAAGVGILLARALSRPVDALSSAARAFGRGDLAVRVPVTTRDGLGRLAETFNHMAGDIAAKDEQIRWWNTELQRKVDERTAKLKSAQEQIVRSQKLTALGSLGAGFAHELNNPLTGLLGALSLLKLDPNHDAELVGMAHDQAKRISGIVTEFQRFAEQESVATGAPTSPIALTKAALGNHGERIREQRVRLDLRFGHKLPPAQVDAFQMEQCLSNVVANALDAMPDGGRLSLNVADVEGHAVRIELTDTGRGISPEDLPRVFDPFFSTKARAENVGMGLAAAHSLLGSNGGSIDIRSELGTGTTVAVILPAAAHRAHLE